MDNTTWRLLLHTTDGQQFTYTLSRWTWQGPVKRSGGIEDSGICQRQELPSFVDQAVDLALSLTPPEGQPLPF